MPSYRVYFFQKIKKAPEKKVAPWRLLGACAPFPPFFSHWRLKAATALNSTYLKKRTGARNVPGSHFNVLCSQQLVFKKPETSEESWLNAPTFGFGPPYQLPEYDLHNTVFLWERFVVASLKSYVQCKHQTAIQLSLLATCIWNSHFDWIKMSIGNTNLVLLTFSRRIPSNFVQSHAKDLQYKNSTFHL